MGGITQIVIFGIFLTIANGLPHLNRNRPLYNGLYGLPDFCANQYRNLGQAFLCHYYYGLRNSRIYNNFGYRSIPELYDRYKDDSSDYPGHEDVPAITDERKFKNKFEEVSINPDSEIPHIIMDNDAMKDLNKDHDEMNDVHNAKSHVKDNNQNGQGSETSKEKDIVEETPERKISEDKISNIVFPDDIDEVKTLERMKLKFDKDNGQDIHRHIDKEQRYSDLAYPHNMIYFIPNNNQPVKSINSVLPITNGGNRVNSDEQVPLLNSNFLGNRLNPFYVSNNALPEQVNTYNQNLNTKQPTYYEVPLNNVPIILVPKEGQTIVSNTRQVIVAGNGQNIPSLFPNQIFILNNGQYLPSSDDQNSPSGNNIPQDTVRKAVPDSNENELKSNNQNIIQDNINNTPEPSLPKSNDIISQIFNQDLPKTNEPLPVTPKEVEQDPVNLPTNQNRPEATQNKPQESEQHLPQDSLQSTPQNNGQALPLPLDNGPKEDNTNLPQNNDQLFESGEASNMPQNNGAVQPEGGKNVPQEQFPYTY